jgi:hypothetical protein
MEHTLDVNKLEEIFDGLEANAHKLNSWEIDRLPEWRALWERGVDLGPTRLRCLEQMWLKI